MLIQQGEIFDIDGSLWIVVDHFYNRIERHLSVHCAPILDKPELRLQLDVPIAFQPAYVSLSLIKKHKKVTLNRRRGAAHPSEVEQIRRNLITRFSYYTLIDLDDVNVTPSPPEEPASVHPGVIFNYKGQTVCIVDHWGCFNDYPLLYVAPVVGELADPTPLDVDISSQLRDLFNEKYFVRTDEIFLVDRLDLNVYGSGPTMLTYGLVRKTSRAIALKFGQLGLLL